MKRVLCLLAALSALMAAGPAFAQSAEAESSLTIHRGLNVSTIRPLRLQPTPEGSALSLSAVELADGPALIEVTGDANRLYRIQVADGGREISLQIWSTNAGDISQSRVAVMNADGYDLLRISGDPVTLRRIAGLGAQIPLNIQYE